MSIRRISAFALCTLIFITSASEAARTIRIVSRKEGVQLTNPSNVPVNYDVACFKSDGTALVSQSGQTLNPGVSINHGMGKQISEFPTMADACTSNGPGYFSMQPMTPAAVGCNTNNTYDNAQNACAEGLEVCTYAPHQYVSCGATPTGKYWVKPPSMAVTFSVTNGPWDGTPMNTATEGIVLGEYCSSVTTFCSTNGGASSATRCGVQPKTSTAGTLCCAKTSASFCRVTINTADANAYLASPQFKGGSPF